MSCSTRLEGATARLGWGGELRGRHGYHLVGAGATARVGAGPALPPAAGAGGR
jgi:hypothetical protein